MKFNCKLSTCLVLLVTSVFLPLCVTAEHTNSDRQFKEAPFKGIRLQRSNTLLVFPGGAQNGKEGEAFECEGDNPQNTSGGSYVCSNSFATYGCNEECGCCFYEEKYQNGEDDNVD